MFITICLVLVLKGSDHFGSEPFHYKCFNILPNLFTHSWQYLRLALSPDIFMMPIITSPHISQCLDFLMVIFDMIISDIRS